MTFVLWISEDDGIDLGPTPELLAAFREMAQAADGDEYGQLWYVPQTADETMPADYIAAASAQAADLLVAAGDRLGGHARWVLERLAAAGALEEAFSPDQPRYPKGHPKAGQWRPKIAAGRGRIAPGHLKNDLFYLRYSIKAAQEAPQAQGAVVGTRRLAEIGHEVEKIALRYSTRRDYEKRLADIRAERRRISDAHWERWEGWAHTATGEEWKAASMDEERFLSARDKERLAEIVTEELKLARDRDRADKDAILGVLAEMRKMGGKVRQGSVNIDPEDPDGYFFIALKSGEQREVTHETTIQAIEESRTKVQAAYRNVAKLLPADWLADTSAKGEVHTLLSTKRAWHRRETPSVLRDPWEAARHKFTELQSEGHKFLGLHKQYPFALFADRDTGEVFALRQDGTVVTEAWDRVRLVSFPMAGEGTLEDILVPAHSLPAAPLKPGAKDYYAEMRAEALRLMREEGYAWVGMRGKWGTLRSPQGEEVSLDWAGKPLTSQVGAGGTKAALPPLLPGVIPDPPPPKVEDSTIRVDPRDEHKVLHELAHRMEVVVGEENQAGYRPLHYAALLFLQQRTQGESLVKLIDLYPGYAYEDDEVTRPDKFVDAYVGKDYGGRATEVITMGLEMLFYPRYKRDLADDPEMKRWVLGLLAAA